MSTAHTAELSEYLAESAERCRAERAWGPVFRFGVAGDIAADVAREEERASDVAYSAEQEDLEAAKILEDAARDGLTQCDMPAVARAIRLIRRSARHDANISAAFGRRAVMT